MAYAFCRRPAIQLRSANVRAAGVRAAVLLALLFAAFWPHAAMAQVPGAVRISQIYAQGGSNASRPRADFIELYNAGTTPVNLAGWTIQFASPTTASWTSIPLSGIIAPRSYRLIQIGNSAVLGTNLTPDILSQPNIGLDSASGKVALANTNVGWGGRPPCPLPTNIVDFVGYGTADQRFPCGAAGATLNNAPTTTSAANAILRRCAGKAQVGGNLDTFEILTVNPRNSASPANNTIDISIAPVADPIAAFATQTINIDASVSTTTCSGPAASVTIDLSAIGGGSATPMTSLGGGLYRATVNLGPLNPAPGSYNLSLQAAASQLADVGTGKVTLLIRPSNDECAQAQVVSSTNLPATFSLNTDGAQPDQSLGTCSATPSNYGVWYRFTPSVGGTLTIAESGGQNIGIGIFTGGSCGTLSSTLCTFDESASLSVQAGTAYTILVAREGTSTTAPPLTLRFSLSTFAVNDLACNAAPITLGVAISGANTDATSTNDGPVILCSTGAIDPTRAVWYSFVPPNTGLYRISSCGSAMDTDLSLFTISSCPSPTFTPISGGCATLGCIGGEPGPGPGPGSSQAAEIPPVSLTAGTSYLVRVSSFDTPQGGRFRLLITRVFSGACCNFTTGACSIVLTQSCPSGQTYLGNDTICTPTNCVPATPGACCNYAAGTCTLTISTACTSGLTFLGQGTVCTTTLCQVNNDECSSALPLALANSAIGSTIDATTSAAFDLTLCGTTNAFDGADVFFVFTPAISNLFEFSLCGSDFDSVLSIHSGCPATPFNRLACNDDASPRCGQDDLRSARVRGVLMNAGQPYFIRVAGYRSETGRFTLNAEVYGACCRGTTCSIALTTPSLCAGNTPAGVPFRHVPSATACNLPGVNIFPCCLHDFDKNGTVDVSDIFSFLGQWFNASPFARFGGDGTSQPAVGDIFSFLGAWFDGSCPG